ncbi:MAG: hypothetical protein R3C99_02240 [Pirellulaceae bacterium]
MARRSHGLVGLIELTQAPGPSRRQSADDSLKSTLARLVDDPSDDEQDLESWPEPTRDPSFSTPSHFDNPTAASSIAFVDADCLLDELEQEWSRLCQQLGHGA